MSQHEYDRRAFLTRGASAAALLPLGIPGLGPRRGRMTAGSPDDGSIAWTATTEVSPDFPRQDRARVQEMVAVSHGNLERVRELIVLAPELAKAAVDWGFGDWETALGAAAHTGNREIAELLLQNGARPNLFSAAMLGQLEVVRATIAARPGVQRTPGPHGITLLSHARAGGPSAEAVVSYLDTLGDADVRRRPFMVDDEHGRQALGNYRYGDGDDEILEVVESSGAGVRVQRTGGVARQLMYREDGGFHPIGAESVEVRFDFDGESARSLTIRTADAEIMASRERP